MLHHYVGLPLGEIAEILGVPYGTVGSRLHHATRAMRASIAAGDRSAVTEGSRHDRDVRLRPAARIRPRDGGPAEVLRPTVVEAALAEARPLPAAPADRAGPRSPGVAGPTSLLGNPATARLALVGLVMLLLLALVGTAIGVGGRLLRGVDPAARMGGHRGDGRRPGRLHGDAAADGRVLVAGGGTSKRSGLTSAELYDPASGTWTATAVLGDAVFQTATLLTGGRCSSQAEPPTAGGWRARSCSIPSRALDPHGLMAQARGQHVAVLLPDGNVLVAGGMPATRRCRRPRCTTPTTGSWTPTGPMTDWRASPTAHPAPGRKGCSSRAASATSASAELYDPATGPGRRPDR